MADDGEANSLTGRVKRYAKVGRAMGGLAARVAGQRYLGIKVGSRRTRGRPQSRPRRSQGTADEGGADHVHHPDALPKEYVEELRQLQANAPAMGWPFVKRRMAAELGPTGRSASRNSAMRLRLPASLGQVHRAHSLDGKLLACKLQYPDMQSAVEADLGQLKLIFRLLRAVRPRHRHRTYPRRDRRPPARGTGLRARSQGTWRSIG